MAGKLLHAHSQIAEDRLRTWEKLTSVHLLVHSSAETPASHLKGVQTQGQAGQLHKGALHIHVQVVIQQHVHPDAKLPQAGETCEAIALQNSNISGLDALFRWDMIVSMPRKTMLRPCAVK